MKGGVLGLGISSWLGIFQVFPSSESSAFPEFIRSNNNNHNKMRRSTCNYKRPDTDYDLKLTGQGPRQLT